MDEMLDSADAMLPSRDMCTFLRAALGGATMELFPPPHVVACTSHLCEGAPKIARIAADIFGVEYLFMDVPPAFSEDAIQYVAKQLRCFADRLSGLSGLAMDFDGLRNAIELSNQARSRLRDVYEMRKHVPSPATGSQFIGLGLIYPWGTRDGVDIAESLRDEMAHRMVHNAPPVAEGEKYRILWIHLRPVFETDIMAHLEQELGAVIVSDLIGEPWWPELDSSDPFRALAIKVLSNPELQPVAKRIERILRLGREYNVDGIVHFLQWGCRWNYGQSRIFKDVLNREGLPFLGLDGDAVDKKASPHGQILTRLEGFVEVLEARCSDG